MANRCEEDSLSQAWEEYADLLDEQLQDAYRRNDQNAIQEIRYKLKDIEMRIMRPDAQDHNKQTFLKAEDWPKDTRFDKNGCLPIIYLIAVSTTTISATLLQALARSS